MYSVGSSIGNDDETTSINGDMVMPVLLGHSAISSLSPGAYMTGKYRSWSNSISTFDK